MYPLGVLFGLGFDTATEIALLVLAAGAGAAGLPFYAILCLPILFAAGMSLLDTIDGSFMNFAYGWAFSKPVRKVYYNITITGLSVAVALFIGTIELVGLFTDRLGLRGSVAEWFQNFNINTAGFIIVGMFVVTWAVALAVWRLGKIEEKWTAGLDSGGAAPDSKRPTTADASRPRRPERRSQGTNQCSGAVGAAPPGPRMGPRRPRVPAERPVVLAHERLELAAVRAAGVALGPVHPAPVPRQPAAGLGVDVLAVAQVEQLALERYLRLGVWPRPADLAFEHDRYRHLSSPPRLVAALDLARRTPARLTVVVTPDRLAHGAAGRQVRRCNEPRGPRAGRADRRP